MGKPRLHKNSFVYLHHGNNQRVECIQTTNIFTSVNDAAEWLSQFSKSKWSPALVRSIQQRLSRHLNNSSYISTSQAQIRYTNCKVKSIYGYSFRKVR